MGKTILVIDDEKSLLDVMGGWLTVCGYKVETATSGAVALEKLNTISPSLIFLDIKMPGMDGFEVLFRLRRNPKTSSVPVIMLTGTAATASILKALEMRAVDYIIKPFEADSLLKLIRRYEQSS